MKELPPASNELIHDLETKYSDEACFEVLPPKNLVPEEVSVDPQGILLHLTFVHHVNKETHIVIPLSLPASKKIVKYLKSCEDDFLNLCDSD